MSGSIKSVAKASNHGAPTETVLPPKAKAENKSSKPEPESMADAALISFKGASDEKPDSAAASKMPVAA